MKKELLFSFVLLAGYAVFSQDYQCIKDDADYFFWDGTVYHTISIDSVKDNTGYKTYYNFTVVGKDDYQTECYTKDWSSWIGPKTDIYNNGDHYFYNYLTEPILIKALGNTGDNWICYTFNDGRYIESTIIQKLQLDFVGLTDSVKKVSFQVKNANGIPISHSINDKQIWMSKNHGLVKALNFKLFPDLIDVLDYYVEESDLKGISNPEMGIQNLTVREIYDYDVGDEFHVWEHTWIGGSSTDFKRIITITGKEWIGDSVVIYTKKRCERKRYFGSPDTVIIINDTLVENINFNHDYWLPLNQIPEKNTIMGDSLDHSYPWNMQGFDEEISRRHKEISDYYFSFYPHDCIYEIITKATDDIEDNGFTGGWAEGLGGGYWNNDLGGWVSVSGLVYFKKGDEEWGEPYYCDSLLTGFYKNQHISEIATIAPNPMHIWSRLSINNSANKEYHFQLFNSMGVMVKEYHFQNNDLIIPRENLNNGIYLYLLTDGQKAVKSGKLIIR
jgi:hypothetical protein